jgi:hypothetical protein
MRRPLFSIVTASILLAGVGAASAQTSTTTTTTWSNDEGTGLREYSTTRHYKSFDDPAWQPRVGAELPGNATIYPLPDTMHVPSAERYSYGIVNNSPVIVERTTRRVVHTWD